VFLKKWPAEMPGTTELPVCSVLLATLENQSMHLLIKVGTDKGKDVDMKALLNSGAGGIFMDHQFAGKNNIQLHPLMKPISIWNMDGIPNKKGTITHYAK
jgi:hypothetical protein